MQLYKNQKVKNLKVTDAEGAVGAIQNYQHFHRCAKSTIEDWCGCEAQSCTLDFDCIQTISLQYLWNICGAQKQLWRTHKWRTGGGVGLEKCALRKLVKMLIKLNGLLVNFENKRQSDSWYQCFNCIPKVIRRTRRYPIKWCACNVPFNVSLSPLKLGLFVQ